MELLLKAVEEIGVSERTEPARVKEYHRSIGKDWDVDVSWCSSFMNWVAMQCGYERTKSGLAQSWLKLGEEIKPKDALPGDIVVLKRGTKSWQGHVGLIIGETSSMWIVLGGNQRDAVRVAMYSKSRTLGVRRVRKYSWL